MTMPGWKFRAGTATRAADGLQVVAAIRPRGWQPDPHLTAESLSLGLDDVIWEVSFPDYRRLGVPWREALATPQDMMNYCDEKWPANGQ